jgi:hypothetical protein
MPVLFPVSYACFPLRERRTAHGRAFIELRAMATSVEEGVGPVALLVNDASKLAVVIEPWSAWLSGKALSTSESRILAHRKETKISNAQFRRKVLDLPE